LEKRLKKIVIDGNSVVSRVRPQDGESYSILLGNCLSHEIANISRGHKLIGESSRSIDSYLIHHPDVVILNFGINELCSRSMSLGLYKYLYFKTKRSNVGHFIEGGIKYFESKFRSTLVNLRFRRSWYRFKRFERAHDELLDNLLKYSKAHIICIGVNVPSQRIEEQLPGSVKRVEKWNKRLNSKYKELNRVSILLTDDIDRGNIPDGIHFDKVGHEILYNRILRIIND